MGDEPTYCGFCKQQIANGSEHSMQVWTEQGRVKGLLLTINGKELRHECRR